MRFIVFAAMFAAAACGVASSGPTPKAGATLKPGQWEFVDEMLDIKSDTMPPQYVDRLRRAADGRTRKRCIRDGDQGSIFALFDSVRSECSINGTELKDGVIDISLNCPSADGGESATLKGSYDAENIVATNHVIAKSNVQALANVEYSLRTTGRRIGECS